MVPEPATIFTQNIEASHTISLAEKVEHGKVLPLTV
jgi:hypothetical protein